MTSRDIRLNRINVAVIAIIAAGIILRLYGTNWDEGLYLHPDERFIAIVSAERIDLPEPGRFTTIFEPANS
ncbi:MAG TPA: hypothetical protein VMM78_00825, partial [Thermomicrobiales bacterium]|nr:hypothetical protein [Thermomicrobiales bacterium]